MGAAPENINEKLIAMLILDKFTPEIFLDITYTAYINQNFERLRQFFRPKKLRDQYKNLRCELSTYPYKELNMKDGHNTITQTNIKQRGEGYDKQKFKKFRTHLRVFNFETYHITYATSKGQFVHQYYPQAKRFCAQKMLEVLYYEFGCPDLVRANKIIGTIGRRVMEDEGPDCNDDYNATAVICLYSDSDEEEEEKENEAVKAVENIPPEKVVTSTDQTSNIPKRGQKTVQQVEDEIIRKEELNTKKFSHNYDGPLSEDSADEALEDNGPNSD